ncbi:ABC transporter permease [Natrinema caseinilyticum]|uniref:ABC transporter permease n=1 Tax=Natrinema caseinilyticum TaxID=2961570 RepID=UPI003CCD2DA5
MLFDRQFGLLEEFLVTPVDRVSVAIGRVTGSTTTAVIRGVLLLGISMVIGFRLVSWLGLVPTFVFMTLIGATFIGVGLISASRINDFHAFNLIFNFVLFPLLFRVLYPVTSFLSMLRYVTYSTRSRTASTDCAAYWREHPDSRQSSISW